MLTRPGWVTLAAGVTLAAAGRLLGVIELFVLGTTTASLPLLAVAWIVLRRLDLSVDRELHPPKVHAGSPSRVELAVRNTDARRSPVLTLRDEVSGTRGATLLVAPLEPDERTRAAYRLPTERRGILTVGPLDIRLTDPLGLARSTVRASGATELTVYPHVDVVVPVPRTTGDDPHAGAEHPNAFGRSGEDFYALRAYVVGDDLRRVHWPSTARHDELMVRQDELPWQSRCTVLLDIRTDVTTPVTLERAISAAASIVTAGADRQDLIRLVATDGSDSGFAAGHAHVESIMEHLATVEGGHDPGFRRVLDRLGRSSTGGSLVAVVGHPPASDLELISRLRQRFGSVTVISFDPGVAGPGAGDGDADVFAYFSAGATRGPGRSGLGHGDGRRAQAGPMARRDQRSIRIQLGPDESFPDHWNRAFGRRAATVGAHR